MLNPPVATHKIILSLKVSLKKRKSNIMAQKQGKYIKSSSKYQALLQNLKIHLCWSAFAAADVLKKIKIKAI